MTKKEIVVSIVVFIVLLAIGIGGFLVWNHYFVWKQSVKMVEERQALANATPPSNSIEIKSSTSTPDTTGGLKVDTSANTTNPAQLGSGKSNNSSSSTSSSGSSNAPGPESFGQYEQYKDSQNALFGDIKVGTGTEVVAGSKVAISYKGWLTSGTLFDQSRINANGSIEPFVFTVGQHQVITGMEQDIVGMKVGGTRRMIIPPIVGYGAQAKDTIPANSVLIFDVQLVTVE